jgi:transposase InsO family protein
MPGLQGESIVGDKCVALLHPAAPLELPSLLHQTAEGPSASGPPVKEHAKSGAELQDAESVLAQLRRWFKDYNTPAPHSALGIRSPAEYRVAQLTLSSSR